MIYYIKLVIYFKGLLIYVYLSFYFLYTLPIFSSFT